MTETNTSTPNGHVLIVEDDEGLCSLLADEVREAGFEVETAQSAEEARSHLEQRMPDVIVSDLRLPGANGMELLRHVQGAHLPPAFIVITAFGSIPQAVEALKEGADNFLTKPLNLDHFVLTVERTLQNRQLREKVQAFEAVMEEEDFHGMIGRSRPMRVLFDQIRQVARARGPVLVTGESGTGKELVARAVHAESDRADRPFLAVNCAGVPRDLLESEFFGHEEGAFTGANESRDGLFVEADGGTLLLDEITEMPPALQAKLLRVLQEDTVRPVGSNESISVDVRIVASTNRDLEAAVEEGDFRTDLFYRLETFELSLPPLRERGEDIDLLASHFLHRFATRMEKEVGGMTPEAVQRIKNYPFPGNVRELENAMERAVTFCQGTEVDVDDLPARIRNHEATPPADLNLQPLLGNGDALPTLDHVEQAYIEYVLDQVDGNKSKAASILGIGRRTLYRRLEETEQEVQ